LASFSKNTLGSSKAPNASGPGASLLVLSSNAVIGLTLDTTAAATGESTTSPPSSAELAGMISMARDALAVLARPASAPAPAAASLAAEPHYAGRPDPCRMVSTATLARYIPGSVFSASLGGPAMSPGATQAGECTWSSADFMGLMNFFFYLALSYIPLGITMALEFTGPLGVALVASRRAIDFLWISLAALGLAALLPLGLGGAPLSGLGIAYALAAGACWALYIVFGRRAGKAHGGQITSLGTVIGACVIVPIGFAHSGAQLFSPAILPMAIGVAVLSSALPYTLEMFAMPRIPTRTFGVLMSLNPALGAVAGLVFLQESLTLIQWTAIASIIAASAGSAATRELLTN